MSMTRTQWNWLAFLFGGLALWASFKSGEAEMFESGLSKGKKRSDFDPRELRKGIRIEMEHTDDPHIAEKIAMDHLTEDPKYYARLIRAGL